MARTIQAAVIAVLVLISGSFGFAAEHVFDPSRDSSKDLISAEVRAKAERKNILLDVGGNWCPWCILLDRTIHEDSKLNAAMQSAFIVVHVNWSIDNRNQAFLTRYPKVTGYPYFFVLSASGQLLQAQATDPLESDHDINHGYNHEAILNFVNKWDKSSMSALPSSSKHSRP